MMVEIYLFGPGNPGTVRIDVPQPVTAWTLSIGIGYETDMESSKWVFDAVLDGLWIDARQSHVVAVTDKDPKRDFLQKYLAGRSKKSTFYRTGGNALKSYTSDMPDIIFAEMILPDMSGIEFVRKVAEIEERRQEAVTA